MALRCTPKLIFNGTCRNLFRLSKFRFNGNLRRLNHHAFYRESQRPSVQVIMDRYQNRSACRHIENDSHVSNEDRLVPIDEPAFHVVLNVRPNEFHKLPPKCSACGSIFQSDHETHEGYIEKDKLTEALRRLDLDKLTCIHCNELRETSFTKLSRVANADAMNQLHHLKHKQAFILYVVDVLDMEGSMLTNIVQLVGKDKPMIVVGNKLDRIPSDFQTQQKPRQQIRDLGNSLHDIAMRNGLQSADIRDVCLVSAKTGFGLKDLLYSIYRHRNDWEDVYLVGCTNTGKSTLYNLINNLFTVHTRDEMPAQAIVSTLPGTTKSLVREGISSWKFRKLAGRISEELREDNDGFDFDDELLDFMEVERGTKRFKRKYTPFGPSTRKKREPKYKLLGQSNDSLAPRPVEIIDESPEGNKREDRFIYDTPGIQNPLTLTKYLDPLEFHRLNVPFHPCLIPRSFLLKPGRSILIGGIGRLDFLDIQRVPSESEEEDAMDFRHLLLPAAQSIFVTVMVPHAVPIHPTYQELADENYERWFKEDFLRFPEGSEARYKDFPKLSQQSYTILGKGRNVNACDLVLNGIGWLSVSAVARTKVSLELHTPNGEGQCLRLSPLLPYTVNRKKGRGVKYLGNWNTNIYGYSTERCPQLTGSLENIRKEIDTTALWMKRIPHKFRQDALLKAEELRLERLEQGIVLDEEKELMEQEEKLRLIDEEIAKLSAAKSN